MTLGVMREDCCLGTGLSGPAARGDHKDPAAHARALCRAGLQSRKGDPTPTIIWGNKGSRKGLSTPKEAAGVMELDFHTSRLVLNGSWWSRSPTPRCHCPKGCFGNQLMSYYAE